MPAQSSAQPSSSQELLGDLGRRLRVARERAGHSLSGLARLAGMSRRHLTEIEAGRSNLTVARLVDLAHALEVGPGELLSFGSEGIAVARGSRIALVGLRGAGKSTIGRALALELEVPFIELDRRIEELAGLALAAIFELHGAAGFRRLEAEALERVLAEGERFVLATGGSIVTSPGTFERLCRACHTVWLKAPSDVHYERVLRQGDRRPMAGRPRALEELKTLLSEREPLYARCEVQLDTSKIDPESAVATLSARFG
jgi:XRE family transcriptional regulator, aerobic/anaerobic benzoate catabolism transcriptional regulator